MLYLWGIYWWVSEPTFWKYIPWGDWILCIFARNGIYLCLQCHFFIFTWNYSRWEVKLQFSTQFFSDIFYLFLNTCFCSILRNISRGSTFNIFESMDMTQSGFKLMLWRGWGQLRQLLYSSQAGGAVDVVPRGCTEEQSDFVKNRNKSCVVLNWRPWRNEDPCVDVPSWIYSMYCQMLDVLFLTYVWIAVTLSHVDY